MDLTVLCGGREVVCEYSGEPRLAGVKKAVHDVVEDVVRGEAAFDLYLVDEKVMLDDENVAMLCDGSVLEVRARRQDCARTHLIEILGAPTVSTLQIHTKFTRQLHQAVDKNDTKLLTLLVEAYPDRHSAMFAHPTCFDTWLSLELELPEASVLAYTLANLRSRGASSYAPFWLRRKIQNNTPLVHLIARSIMRAGYIGDLTGRDIHFAEYLDDTEGLLTELVALHNGPQRFMRAPPFEAFLKALLERGARPDTDILASMTRAISGNAVRLLVSHGANVNATVPILEEEGDGLGDGVPVEMGIVRRVLAKNRSSEPLFCDMVTTLVSCGMDLEVPNSSTGNTVLLDACLERRDAESIKGLVEAGANVSLIWKGQPLVWYLMNTGQLDALSAFMVAIGSEVDVVDKKGRTMLMRAVSTDNVRAVDALLKGNPNLALTDPEGRTCLTYAVSAQAKSMVLCKLLLKHNAPINAGTITPLEQAVLNRDQKLCKYLLSNGADAHKPCANGKAYTELRTRNDIITMLGKADAKGRP